MRIRIDNVSCGLTALHVHSHIKRSVIAEGKTSLGGIELVGANPQIGEDAVEPLRKIQEGVVVYKSKVVVYQLEARILRGVCQCILIPVEGHQATLRGEP